MVTFFMILFVILCFFLALFILLQQGKGDMGLGGLSGGSQALFGGSGGQEFFERVTWVMVAIFIAGSLGLTIFKSRATQVTRVTLPAQAQQQPTQQVPAGNK